jgi:hypothetical protein
MLMTIAKSWLSARGDLYVLDIRDNVIIRMSMGKKYPTIASTDRCVPTIVINSTELPPNYHTIGTTSVYISL